MTSTTHTKAGLVALAGAARLGGHGTSAQGVYGHHQSSWTVGAIAKPATFMVFDLKNRPTTRPHSERSP